MSINQADNKLPLSYYHNADVVFLAKDLLGKQIFTNFNNKLTSGIIVETEAYRSTGDRASHAYLNKRTKKIKFVILVTYINIFFIYNKLY